MYFYGPIHLAKLVLLHHCDLVVICLLPEINMYVYMYYISLVAFICNAYGVHFFIFAKLNYQALVNCFRISVE